MTTNLYVTSSSDYKLKPNNYCLLRYGVSNNSKQTFLLAIYDIISKGNDNNTMLINYDGFLSFKKYLVKNLTLDKFVSAQKGNLLLHFNSKKQEKKGETKISTSNIKKQKSTKS